MTTRRGLLRSIEFMGVLGLAAKSGMLSALAQDVPLLADPKPFSSDFVQGIARELASRPFQEEKVDLPAGLQNLTYDQFKSELRLAYPLAGDNELEFGARYRWDITPTPTPWVDRAQLFLGVKLRH